MDEKKITPKDIAPYMNISVRTIYRTIRAERCPNLADLVYFLALKVPIEEFYEIDWEENIVRVPKRIATHIV